MGRYDDLGALVRAMNAVETVQGALGGLQFEPGPQRVVEVVLGYLECAGEELRGEIAVLRPLVAEDRLAAKLERRVGAPQIGQPVASLRLAGPAGPAGLACATSHLHVEIADGTLRGWATVDVADGEVGLQPGDWVCGCELDVGGRLYSGLDVRVVRVFHFLGQNGTVLDVELVGVLGCWVVSPPGVALCAG